MKKGIEKGAKQAWKGAKWAAKQGSILACKGLFKAQAALASAQGKANQWIGKAVNKLRRNSKVVNDVIAAGEKFQQTQKEFIANAIKKSLKFNKPAVLKKVTLFMKPQTICEQGIPTAARGLGSLLAGKNPIRSRSIPPVWSIGPQVAFATPKVLGGEGGIGFVFPPGSAKSPKLYYFAGGTASLPQISLSGVLQVATWFPALVKNQQGIGGGYLALGYTIPIKELSNIPGWIPGEQGVPHYKGGGGKDIVVVIDIIFSWPKGKAIPILWPPAGVIVSPGVSGGLSKLQENIVTKHLGRVTLQGGYTWVGNKNIW